jgi:hypothetical protein
MPDAVDGAGSAVLVMELRGTATAGVRLPADVIAYFGITRPVGTAEAMQLRERDPYSRRVYNGAGDTTGKVSTVRGSSWEVPVKAPKGVSGVAVRIPTELKTAKGKIRYVTVRFPQKATVGDISNFIFEKFLTHKPKHFIHNTVQYSVLKGTGRGVLPAGEQPEATA